MGVPRVFVFSLLLLCVTALDVSINQGVAEFFFPLYEGYPSGYEILEDIILGMRIAYYFGDAQVDYLYFQQINNYFPNVYDAYLNTETFAPWPASHTTLFAPNRPYNYVYVNSNGFFTQYYLDFNDYYPGEYMGIDFSIPAVIVVAELSLVNYEFDFRNSRQYYYEEADDYIWNWPYQNLDPENSQEASWVTPFHVTVLTSDGYFYYDWLTSRHATEYYRYWDNFGNDLVYVYTYFTLLAQDPKGIDTLLLYSRIPENNREGIYWGYGEENFVLPYNYNWLYLESLFAQLASPSTTQTISATTTPTPNFLRQPTHTATRSPSGTHTRTPAPSHSKVYQSGSNTPTRTPNLSATRSPTPSKSFVPSASRSRSASVVQPSNSPIPPTPSNSPIPVSVTKSPIPTKTATVTRTAFLTASNTQAPGRNVPSASIAPSASKVVAPFSQPGSSTAALVQFNVQCTAYCSGESASALQLAIARALNLNEEFIRIVAVHEFFEGDSEITILICSTEVDEVLNSIQGGSFTQDYFVSISVESVDWTVRCDMDLYNYLALSTEYFVTASSATQVVPALLLFICQFWLLA